MKSKQSNLKISRTWSFNEKVAKVFDTHVNQSIPLYSEFHKQSAKIAEFYCKENSIIYDLGCSTGKFILEICKYKKKLNIFGIDNSKKMIEIAKKKTSKVKNNKIYFICNDLFKVKFKKSNLIFCSLLMPFFNSIEQKKLIKKIYNSLHFGGSAIILNKSISKYPNFENIFNQLYSDFKLKKGINADDLIKKTRSLRSVHTLNATEDDILLFKKIGFRKIEIFFKYLNFTGFVIEK